MEKEKAPQATHPDRQPLRMLTVKNSHKRGPLSGKPWNKMGSLLEAAAGCKEDGFAVRKSSMVKVTTDLTAIRDRNIPCCRVAMSVWFQVQATVQNHRDGA